jgi:transcriptional regulator with XRE-family HTH domain
MAAKRPPTINPGFADAWAKEVRQHPLNGFMYVVMDVVAQIDEELARRHMTRSELAERAGVKVSYVSRVLNDPEKITLRALFRLAKALDLTTSVDLSPTIPSVSTRVALGEESVSEQVQLTNTQELTHASNHELALAA